MRRNGKTTRCVDDAIQELFTKKKLEIYKNKNLGFKDPDSEKHNTAQYHFIHTLLGRLKLEHDGSYKIIEDGDRLLIIHNIIFEN